MKELRTEIVIDATAKRVFRILTNMGRYVEWNPLIISAEGTISPNEDVNIIIRLRNQQDMPYVVRIISIVPDQAFVWIGHFKMRGLLDGLHFFELFPEGDNRVRVVQREEFRGILVNFVWRSFLDTRMREGFEAVNQSLKALAESHDPV